MWAEFRGINEMGQGRRASKRAELFTTSAPEDLRNEGLRK